MMRPRGAPGFSCDRAGAFTRGWLERPSHAGLCPHPPRIGRFTGVGFTKPPGAGLVTAALSAHSGPLVRALREDWSAGLKLVSSDSDIGRIGRYLMDM